MILPLSWMNGIIQTTTGVTSDWVRSRFGGGGRIMEMVITLRIFDAFGKTLFYSLTMVTQ